MRRVTPVANINPVQIDGVKIKNVTLHNMNEIEQKKNRITLIQAKLFCITFLPTISLCNLVVLGFLIL